MFILTFCAERHLSVDYQDCVQACCGSVALVVCVICLILSTFVASILYLIVVGNQWDKCETFGDLIIKILLSFQNKLWSYNDDDDDQSINQSIIYNAP